MQHTDIIKHAIRAMCSKLETNFPGITAKEYNSGDMHWTFEHRMQTALYIELIKAGFIT